MTLSSCRRQSSCGFDTDQQRKGELGSELRDFALNTRKIMSAQCRHDMRLSS